VNTIIVLGNEKLTMEMQKLFHEDSPVQHRVTVLKIPRSAGVAELDFGTFTLLRHSVRDLTDLTWFTRPKRIETACKRTNFAIISMVLHCSYPKN
jgi:hypothetical protein